MLVRKLVFDREKVVLGLLAVWSCPEDKSGKINMGLVVEVSPLVLRIRPLRSYEFSDDSIIITAEDIEDELIVLCLYDPLRLMTEVISLI